MYFHSDSWGKFGSGELTSRPKPSRKKKRKLSRQIRNMNKREREVQCGIKGQVF